LMTGFIAHSYTQLVIELRRSLSHKE
jgi:hypothetical protein